MIREAVILAGGLGTRLHGVVPDVPKSLAPVAGCPFLNILGAWLAGQGVKRVVLSLGYGASMIARHVGKRWMDLEAFCVTESSPLGTGGGLRLALEQCRDDVVLALNGDTYLEFDLNSLSARWDAEHSPLMLAAYVEDTSRYGRLAISEERVVALEEKGVAGAGYINAGAYVLPRNALDNFAPGQAFSLEEEYLTPSLRERPFGVFRVEGMFIDIGVPEDYVAAQTLLVGRASHACDRVHSTGEVCSLPPNVATGFHAQHAG